MFMSPQINKSDFGFYRYFKVVSDPFRNWLKSPDGDLYRPSIIKLDVLVSICTAQIPKSCFVQRCEISILLKHLSFFTKIHTTPLCSFCLQKLEPNKNHLM
jgi:hypothetical protein